ncbi:rRNA maturation RNase YbeY [Sebaldella sp. S0638]|nr:rRNA maturation RNase YbeY [Sebaldella sp. S0638]MCP1222937.1 rRNA maturation RNase YbeY [Sebaldella sp. S0638]
MDEEKINEFVDLILEHEKVENIENIYISFLITTNEVIKNINSEYRGKDTPTDVISFAYNETENIGPFNILGDIIISEEKVREQAEEYEHSVEREFYYVLCHGMLHLLGYDHIDEEDKKVMREKEEQLLKEIGYERG